jgi:UrcA family protein
MTKFFNVRTLGLTLAAATAVMLAGQAGAETPDGPIQVVVRYGDLNLGQPAGAKMLINRIEAASAQACGGQPDTRLLAERATFDHCRKAAFEQAAARIGPVVAAARQEAHAVSVASR